MISCLMIFTCFLGEDPKCTYDTQACLDYMAEKMNGRGWFGVVIDHNDQGQPVVMRVIPKSPADKAGVTCGDILISMNGVRFDADEAARKALKAAAKPGAEVVYVLANSSGVQREVKVNLAEMPLDEKARWIGEHLLKHHAIATAEH